MRILAAVGYFGRFGEADGVVTTYSRLVPLFSRHGHRVDILTHGPEDGIETIAEGVQVISHKPRLAIPLDRERDLDPLFPFFFGGRVVKQRQYDLVQTSAPGPSGLAALQVARKQDLPVLALFHTAFDQYARIRIGRVLGRLAGNAMGAAMRRWITWYYNQADLVLAPSEYSRNELGSWITKPIEVLSRGIDTEHFHPRHRDRSDDRVRVLYVGRVAPEKNLKLLAEIFSSGVDADLTLVGGGPHLDYFRRLMPFASLPGVLLGESLLRTYASADIFAFPSHTDTLGNVILEAMASGLPVVVTDSMGPKELVEHGVTGLVATSDAQFSEYVKLLIRDSELRRRMGIAARESVKSRTWEVVFERLHGFHRRLVTEKQSRSVPEAEENDVSTVQPVQADGTGSKRDAGGLD
jgi:glycosyltransferase involved in cell wall biosynthesis